MNAICKTSRWRLLMGAGVAVVSGSIMSGNGLFQIQHASNESSEVALSSEVAGASELPTDEYVSVTAENRSDIAQELAASAATAPVLDHLSEEQHQVLNAAVEASIAALLGEPDLMVEYQTRYGAKLDSDSLRSWVGQLHEWGMIASVSVSEADDMTLFKEAVRADEERFAEVVGAAVGRVNYGVRLDVEAESPEWPYPVLVWKISAWQPLSGYLGISEGEAIKEGTSGRTASVAFPARFASVGEGVLRVNFYWDTDRKYWVPHMAMMGLKDGAGETCPMMIF